MILIAKKTSTPSKVNATDVTDLQKKIRAANANPDHAEQPK